MVVAKHDAAHEELARQFHDREVEKEYVALVWGDVQAGRRIDAPIGRDPANRKKMSARARRSREAVTRIVGAEHFGRALTLAQVAIHTGRTHQIRVHLSAIGHPIVGDSLYGGVHRRVPGDLRAVTHLERPFLHAARLAFKHPADGRRMEFASELPDDLQRVLDELREPSEFSCRSSIKSRRLPGRSRRASRFPNGREHEVAIVRHPPSVVLIPDARRRPGDPDPPVSARASTASCGSCRRAASNAGEAAEEAAAAGMRGGDRAGPGTIERLGACSRRPGSATRS